VTVSRRELLAGAALLLLAAVAAVRIAMVDRPPLRPLSVEGMVIPSEPIASGQRIVREAQWHSPSDVYVMGWSYRLGAPTATLEVTLRHGDTVLFLGPRGPGTAQNPMMLPPGTGYRLPANESLILRVTIVNSGPAGETSGTQALVYFVPVEGN